MKYKSRNLMLAVVCLVAFVGLGFLFYTNWVVQRPFAIIVFVSSNLVPNTLTVARAYQSGVSNRFRFEELAHQGWMTNYSGDSLIPDSAAAASALATGEKVNNGVASFSSEGQKLTTLLEEARSKGRSIGVISNRSIFNPVLAAFAAPTETAYSLDAVGRSLMDNLRPDLVLGGGMRDWGPQHQGGARQDEKDLLLEARQAGYDIVRTRSELNSTPTWRPARVVGVFSDGNMAFADEFAAAGTQPSLADMVTSAIQLLQYNRKGYVLVVEAGLVEEAAASNQAERMLRELASLDEAVAAAVDYAGAGALIVLAGTNTVGGFNLSGQPHQKDRGVALLGPMSDGLPSVSWSTGAPPPPGEPAGPAVEPAAIPSARGMPVAGDVLFFGTGLGAEKMSGVRDNTEIYRLLKEQL